MTGYRKRSGLTQKDRERIESIVRQALEERVLLQRVIHPDNGIDIPVQELAAKTLEDAESAAEELRERWRLGLDSIANVTQVLEAHYVHVIEVDESEKFDGISAIVQDGEGDGEVRAAAVVARRGLAGERQRLSLLHELGPADRTAPGR